MAGQRGDVMVMSSAAGLPLSHPAIRMSCWSGVIKVSSEAMVSLFTNAQVGTTTKVKDIIPQAIGHMTKSPPCLQVTA